MRVVIPVLSLHMGGGCRVIAEAANALVDRGHEVCLVLPEKKPLDYIVRCAIVRVPEIAKQYIPAGDVILTNFYPTVMPAVESRRGRVVRLSNGFEPLWVPNQNEALKTYKLRIPVVTLGQHLRGIIKNATGQDCFMAHPGVDPEVFRPSTAPPTTARWIFYIYRMESHGYHYKGNKEFLDAMVQVRRAEPDVEAVVVAPEAHILGTPPLVLPSFCRIVTAVSDSDMAHLYNLASAYVLASEFEALSLPPLEAMACGTPAVVTDCGGVRDYAVPGDNCLMGLPKRSDMLADLILSVLRNQPLRERLIASGLQTAARRTWKRFGDELESALQAILKGAVEPTMGGASFEGNDSGDGA